MTIQRKQQRGFLSRVRGGLVAVGIAAAVMTHAQGPAWWYTRGVMEPVGHTNDFAPASIGQLKHIAVRAYEEMNERLVSLGGAGVAVSNLVSGFANEENYAALNVGQLKNVAKVFYDRLIEVGITNGYPWSLSETDDYALANVGQLKNVFSFEVELSAEDTDGDGMPDAWEEQWFGGLQEAADGDFDDDGADNLLEYLVGTDPAAEWLFPKPVVNEVFYNWTNAESGLYQFVELYNPHPRALRLEHYRLQVGQYNELADVTSLRGRIDAHGYYLIGGAKVVTATGQGADQLVLQKQPFLEVMGSGTGPVAVVYLWHTRDLGQHVDGLAYGRPAEGGITNTFFPGLSLPPHEAVPPDMSVERRIPGVDFNEPDDWVTQPNPTPTAGSGAPMFDPEDLDRDGLSAEEEATLGTDSFNPDSDGDGLFDGDEARLGINPLTQDSDGDGLTDSEEMQRNTNPMMLDTDGDGVWDGTEILLDLNPLNIDSNRDGIPDGEEDSDDDGFTNKEEQAAGSDPASAANTIMSWNLPPVLWRHPYRVWEKCDGDCNAIVHSGNPELFDATYCKRKLKHGRLHCRTAPVQDFQRERAYEFYHVNDSIPVYWFVRFRWYKNDASYCVSGADVVERRQITPRQTLTLYGAQLSPGCGKRVSIIELMGLKCEKSSKQEVSCHGVWPVIEVSGPHFLNVRVPGISGAFEENPGLMLFRNADDDDQDATPDWADDYVPGGDDDMVEVQLEYPKTNYLRDRVRLSWSPQIIRVFEHSSKKLLNTTGGGYPDGWVFNADVGACIPNVPYKGYDDEMVYLEGIQTGTTYFVLKDARLGTLNDRLKITVVDPRIIPDWNHDRIIDVQDETNGVARMPFRFWINNDNDNGDLAEEDSDVPGIHGWRADCEIGGMDGRSDVTDFFPVWLDLHDVLKAWPPDKRTRYVLRHADSAVNVMITDLRRNEAGAYLVEDREVYGVDLKGPPWMAETWSVSASGWELPRIFLNRIREDSEKGVLLLEGRRPTEEPLVLEIWRDGQLACRRELPLRLSSVEDMYRWINLRHVTGSQETRPTNTNEPANYPDTLCNSKHFVFVHGFNVSEEDARGSSAEIFKRLYWSCSRAMFTAVIWQGDETPGILPPAAYYHADVINAFEVAPAVAQHVRTLPGLKNVAAHSLGNMVVSSAIVDHGLTVERYFMIDAAVAMEAYNANAQHIEEMVPIDWQTYTNRLWSTEWHELFDEGFDGRRGLTWRGRFGNLPNAVNYYSSGEDVLNNNDPPNNLYLPRTEKAWVFQERMKGGIRPAILIGVDSHGGWGFNHDYDVQAGEDEYGRPIYETMSPGQAALLTPDQLQTNSFFKRFYRDDLYGTNGSDVAMNPQVRAKLLAEAIPATSRATGRNPINWFGLNGTGNEDMMLMKAKWPRSNGRWLHSDFKNVAYVYVHQLFEDMVDKGALR